VRDLIKSIEYKLQ